MLENTRVDNIMWERYHEEHLSSFTASNSSELVTKSYQSISENLYNILSSTSSSTTQDQNSQSKSEESVEFLKSKSKQKNYDGNIVHRAVGVRTNQPSHNTIDANLVIDCSGVYSKCADWIYTELSEIDRNTRRIEKTRVKSQITNVMAIFKIKPDRLSEGFYKRDADNKPQWLSVFTNPFPKTGMSLLTHKILIHCYQ